MNAVGPLEEHLLEEMQTRREKPAQLEYREERDNQHRYQGQRQINIMIHRDLLLCYCESRNRSSERTSSGHPLEPFDVTDQAVGPTREGDSKEDAADTILVSMAEDDQTEAKEKRNDVGRDGKRVGDHIQLIFDLLPVDTSDRSRKAHTEMRSERIGIHGNPLL